MIGHRYYFADSRYDTLLLIHGWNTSRLYMESFVQPFSNAFNVLLIDLFSQIDKALSVGDFIEEIHQIVEKNLTNDLVVLGHSFGGKLAYFYSEKYPVKGLILIAPSLVRPRRNPLNSFKVFLYKSFRKHSLPIPHFLSGSKDYRNASGVMKETFLLCVHEYLTKKRENHAKTLVIGFRKDEAVRKYQIKKIRKYLPKAEIRFYPGNHFSYLDYVKEIRLDFDEYFL